MHKDNLSVSELPAETCYKVALQILDFNDFTLNEVQPTGFNQMTARHLKQHGYLVVQIPHYEFQTLPTGAQQIKYLQRKLSQSVDELHR